MLTIAKYDRYDMVNNAGEDKPSFTIWFSGCTIRCDGCQNKALWDFNSGIATPVDNVVSIVVTQSEKLDFDTVVLLGGEPLDQGIVDIYQLCRDLYCQGLKIWLYTGYDFDDVPFAIRDCISVIKCGRYEEDLKCDGKLASSNQQLWHKIKDEWVMV
jgi:anaerobic ribonucleoside-triphosphate reductase activating protein